MKIEDIINVKPKHLLMSLNRYERKKNIPLALKAFSEFLKDSEINQTTDYHLVIAGGYDDAVIENKEVHDELVQMVADFKLPKD